MRQEHVMSQHLADTEHSRDSLSAALAAAIIAMLIHRAR
jgi:hypothetical protein